MGKPRSDPIKILIWAYIVLLVFEGALRKWIAPDLSNPLLIVRDPLAILIIFVSVAQGRFPLNRWTIGLGAITTLSGAMTMVAGHGNLFVMLFGARISLLHWPVMFIMGSALDRRDLRNVFLFFLLVSIPMTILVALQFSSPQSAWVNRGLGGIGGAGFSGALGRFRPPGTFSFVTGIVAFYGLVGAILAAAWLNRVRIPGWLKWASTACLILALPLSISRSLVFHIILTICFLLVAIVRQPKLGTHLYRLAIALPILIIFALNSDLFETGMETMSSRFKAASHSEGGLKGTLLDRFLGGLVGAVLDAPEYPVFGVGLGMGTSVGAQLLAGTRGFLVAEGEWGRMIGEMGPILGLMAIALRVHLGYRLTMVAWGRVAAGNPLAWLLLSFSLLQILQSQWGQPTSLGFSTLAGGLTLASLKQASKAKAAKRNRKETEAESHAT